MEVAGDGMTADVDAEHADIEVDLKDRQWLQGSCVARRSRPLERALHEVTHLSLRTWCWFCMMGLSKDLYHARQKFGEMPSSQRPTRWDTLPEAVQTWAPVCA